MTANEIIGKLIAEPKYRFANKELIAEVVRDVASLSDTLGIPLEIPKNWVENRKLCAFCKNKTTPIYEVVCAVCFYDNNKPNFERA